MHTLSRAAASEAEETPHQRASTEPGFTLMRCRLCWMVAGIVFMSILLIEVVIFVPSYLNYERDRLAEFARAARSAVLGGFAVTAAPLDDPLSTLGVSERLLGVAGISGVQLLSSSGAVDSQIGQSIPPAARSLLLKDHTQIVRIDRDAFAVALPLTAEPPMHAFLKVATPDMPELLRAFLLRIAGLVALIALIVTATTMIVLRGAILRRLVSLDRSVSMAAATPDSADAFQVDSGRGDEIGSLSENINRLLRATSSNLRALRQREEQVNLLNATLEQRVAQRTVELRHATTAAQAANNAKTSFLANMSHELRTPLNAIIGFAEVMQSALFGSLGDTRYQTYVRDILASGRHLLGIIEDLLDLSRIEANHIILDESIVDVGQFIAESITLVRATADERGVGILSHQVPPGLAVCGDHRRLRQVTLNLLGNAVKFTSAGGNVSIDAVIGPTEEFGLRVRDDGIGIAEQNLAMVMEPFGQVASTSTRTHQGAGLGLPLSKRLVELHGGRLEIQSRIGFGTTIIAWLPPSRLVVSREQRDIDSVRTGAAIA